MQDITLEQLIEGIEDEDMKAWAQTKLTLPEDFSVNEFLVKLLDAATVAASKQNETRQPGEKLTGYPPPVNGAIARAGSGQLFFPRTSTLVSRVVINLDQSTPALG